jgi:hypothetical protein
MSERYPGGFITKSPPALNPALGNAAPGIWTMDQAMQAVKNGTWPAYDPYFEYTTLLLHGNGTNGAQNNTFLDSSTNNFTITRNGNTTQGTFTPYGSNWSNYFDGTGDYLSIASNAALALPGDFTWECWINPNNFSTERAIYSTATSGGLYIYLSGSSVVVRVFAVVTLITAGTLVAGQWNHVAVVRSGTTVTLYVNGTSAGTATSSQSFAQATTYIGSEDGSTYFALGYISNLRLVKGSALYTSAFTPSTSPLTAITNTSLLTCQSNRFIDNSSNNFTITRNGDVSVQRFSPFAPTAPYSTSVIGGSGYFDGSGDYLNGPTTGQFAPTGDFTISMWFYPTSFAASYYVLAGSWNAGASDEWLIQYDNTGAIRFLTTTDSTFSAAGVVKLNQWQFLSISRSGSTVTGYINGTSFRSYTLTGTVGSATKTVYVGIQAGTTWPYVGYISDYRLVAGSAQSATPPTSPATAISGTNTLLNFTNGGIIDNAMMNDLETVGNAQISTSVKKYGTGSLYFDGSGYLAGASTPNTNIDSGDFTFEAWVYLPDASVVCPIVAKGFGSAGGYMMWVQSTLRVRVYNAAGSQFTATSSLSISNNTWTYIAGVRSGNTITLYINGVADGSVSYSGTSTNSSRIEVGGYNSGTVYLNGYIDDLRITKGYARYTAAFTPPTSQLQDQ